MTNVQGNPRKISVSLYLAALLISTLIFAIGIFVGRALEQENLNSISANVDEINARASTLELLYLAGDSPEFCPVYSEELSKLDASTEQVGFALSYLEDTKGVTDVELKKKYFLLEAKAYLLSQKVREKCGANYSTILYFYSNSNCTTCKQQGLELLAVKRHLGEGVRIYSFDGDLGSKIADALRMRHNVTTYPSIVLNGKNTLNGFLGSGSIEIMINSS